MCRLADVFKKEEHEGTRDNPLHKVDYEAFLQHAEAGENPKESGHSLQQI